MLPISIIIPVYNSETALPRCLKAIRGQRFSDFEILLCDDGSTDGSLSLCREAAKQDSRIRVLPSSHQGVSAARNRGLAHASGRYILFADSDDVPGPDWASFLYSHIGACELGICGYSCIDESGTRLYGAEKNDGEEVENRQLEASRFLEDLFSNRHMYQGYIWNKIFDRSIIQSNYLLFDEKIAYNEDRLFLCRYLLHCRRVNYSNIPQYDYTLRMKPAETDGAGKWDHRWMTEIDAFRIMCLDLLKYQMPSARLYAHMDEYRAVSELLLQMRELESGEGGSAEDRRRLLCLKAEITEELSAAGCASYEEFHSALLRHVPFQVEKPDAHRINMLYQDFLAASVQTGAEPMDYLKYRFYEQTYLQRSEYVTRSGFEELCGRYGTEEARKNITDKCRFVRIYASCMEREILTADKQDAAAEYARMRAVFPRLIHKPGKGEYCKGIRVFSTKDRGACEDVWRIFTEEGGMIEEYICQHEVLSAFHPASVNTIRSVTVISRDGAPVLLAAAIRTGHGGRVTDNADGGGIFTEINVETGTVIGNGRTHFDEEYVRHPDSGLVFAGTRIPEWERFREASKRAAGIQPGLRLCCWDWTLTRDGRWALIEGNVSGGLGLLQMAAGRGMRKEIIRKLGLGI